VRFKLLKKARKESIKHKVPNILKLN